MSILRSLLSAIVLLTLAGAIPIQKNGEVSKNVQAIPLEQKINYRLPKNVLPTNYTIKLEPNIVEGDFRFIGESNISITVTGKDTKNITLHANGLWIDEKFTTLVSVNGKKVVRPVKHEIDNVTEFLTLEFKDVIVDGNYTLNLKYSSELTDDFNGFYRISYKNKKNATVWLATTHFEPTYARRAFPCFDEPALKAQFKISIKHFKNYTAISNMPKLNTPNNSDDSNKFWKWTHFQITPVMSTYLVAFTISDYKNITSKDGKFRVWARENKIASSKYALEIGQQELKLLEKQTGINHVIPKMDTIAIPDDVGAMENWGIVSFPEDTFLYDKKFQPSSEKEDIADLIAHEFAHQWFGNLVTPAWWDHMWLKEGFASYFQFMIPEKAESSWRSMDKFVVINLQRLAFLVDDDESQHAMNVTVNSPDDIMNNFDLISYRKAACVIRMFSHMVGDEVFQTGLQGYLKNNSYSTATPDDLVHHIVSAVKDPGQKDIIKQSLNSWVNEPGYPVVTTEHTSHGNMRISSKRYLSKKPSTELPQYKWWIPINFATEKDLTFNDTKPSKWHESNTSLLFSFDVTRWYIINKQQTGYYRVNYDMHNWKLLAEYLRTKDYDKIHVLNRAQLLDDSFHLAKSGDLKDYEVFLNISTYLEQEDDFAPWHPAHFAFRELDKALMNTDQYDVFKLYIVKLIAKWETTVGYSEQREDNTATKFTRINAIRLACRAGSKNCRTVTHNDLVLYILREKNLSVDLRSDVLCAGIRSANATIWNKTFEFFEKSKYETERDEILTALGCSSNSTILKSYLQKTIAPKSKISEHSSTVINAVSVGSAAGIDVAFDFIKDNLKVLNKTVGNETLVLYHLIDIASRMNTPTQAKKLKQFIKSLPPENEFFAENLTAKAVDKVMNNVQWYDKHNNQIGKFLNSQKLVPDTTDTPPVESTDKPTDEPPVNPPNKPTDKPPVDPPNKPTDKPPVDPPNKPTDKPPVDPPNKPTDKPPIDPPNKPTDKPPVDPPNKPTDKPPIDPPNKPTDEPPNKPTDKPPIDPPNKPTDEPPNKPTDKPPIDPPNKPTDEPPNKPTDKPPIDPPNKPTDEPPVDPPNKPTDKPPIDPPNKPTDEPPVDPPNKPTDEPPVDPPNKPTDEPPVDPPNKPTDKPPVDPPNKPTDEPPVDPPNKPTDEPPVDPPNKPTDEPPVDPPNKPTDEPPVDPPNKPTDEPPVNLPSTDESNNAPNISFSSLPLTIFLALLARFVSRIL